MKKLWNFGMSMYKKYEELVNYLIVGVATTIVYLIATFIFENYIWDATIVIENILINSFGWAVSVIFAYFTNRIFVFKSKSKNMLAEAAKFTGSRLITLGLDVFIMWLFVNVLEVNFWIAKLFISCVLVMIANYVFSKLIVFHDKSTEADEVDETGETEKVGQQETDCE